MTGLDRRLAAAVRQFWQTRQRQSDKQGKKTGRHDVGGRTEATAGGHLDGITDLTIELLIEAGFPKASIHKTRGQQALPGYFRPTKNWDVAVTWQNRLVMALEFKSHIGSQTPDRASGEKHGKNYNNRTEEALGSASDLWTAYREGAFGLSPPPCLGYFMLCEEAPASTRPVRVQEPHFKVFEDFRDASYARRYELLCQRMIRQRLYDAACLILSARTTGTRGAYREPLPELSYRAFIATLIGRATVFQQLSSNPP